MIQNLEYPAAKLPQHQENMLSKLLKQQAAPAVELEPFDGNPINYHYFITMFRQVVENTIDDGAGRLARLIKFTSGEARDMIRPCIHFPSDSCYERAIDLLNDRYGNSYKILASYKQEIKKYPSLKFSDCKAFREFQNFLLKCSSIADHSDCKLLDGPETICQLVSKLPGSLIDRWNR